MHGRMPLGLARAVIYQDNVLRCGCLSDDEQSVTTQRDLLGDLFQKYIPYILFLNLFKVCDNDDYEKHVLRFHF